MRIKYHRRSLLAFLLTIGLFFLSHPLWLSPLYIYLDKSQPPQPADVIVILGGSEGSRETYAAQLYHAGFASTVLISGHVDDMAYNIDVLKKADVPEIVTIINDRAKSTFDEAQQVLEILTTLDAESALIVTNRFHTRRALATYKHVFKESRIDLTIVSPDDSFQSSTWWISEYNKGIALEYPKMLYYWLAYGVWSG